MQELGRAEDDAAGSDDDGDDGEQRHAMIAAWKAILVDGMDGMAQEGEEQGQAFGLGPSIGACAGPEEDASRKMVCKAVGKMKRNE
jgi:hypothetical protein